MPPEGAGDGGAAGVVDLRSDTVTRPDPAMRRAMAEAPVGDEVLGDDPTILLLEERVARLLGKEQALFFPSGTMANQAALAVLGRPGTGVLADARSHVVHYEEGGAAVLSGLQLRPVETPDGILTVERVEAVLNPPSPYLLQDSVLSVENTHMDAGGRVFPLEELEGLGELARERGLGFHMDGARLWHAQAATGIDVARYAAPADTVMVAFSKGLGAPVGSMLAGSAELMRAARVVRRRLGGGMRQTGILAAAALYALERHLDSLAESHRLAMELAEGIRGLPALHAEVPETNIVFIHVDPARLSVDNLLNFLKNRRILMATFGPHRLRAVTHLDVDRQGIKRTLAALGAAEGQT